MPFFFSRIGGDLADRLCDMDQEAWWLVIIVSGKSDLTILTYRQ